MQQFENVALCTLQPMTRPPCDIRPSLQWNTPQLYTTGTLSVASTGIPVDYNLNGTIDAADYVAKKPGAFGGNPDGYNNWRADFGQSIGRGAGTSTNAAIPDPATVMCFRAPGNMTRSLIKNLSTVLYRLAVAATPIPAVTK
jgi:hypothetical protein